MLREKLKYSKQFEFTKKERVSQNELPEYFIFENFVEVPDE